MPTYEYRCDRGHTFEVMQRMSDDPVATCEVCGRPVARVLHPVAVHFKGSGFYNTDYGTRKRQRENAASSDGASGGNSKESKDSKDSKESKETKAAGGAKSGSGTSSGGSSGEGGSKSEPTKQKAASG